MSYRLQVFEVRQTEVFANWLGGLADGRPIRWRWRAANRIAQRIVRLQSGLFGDVLFGDVKPVGEGISELRIDYGPGYRVYFVQRGQDFQQSQI